MDRLKLSLEGKNIVDISSFYHEINKVFMKDEDWEIAESLDALNDLLYGAFGVHNGFKNVELTWRNFSVSKEALGFELTRKYFEEKLSSPKLYNQEFFTSKLNELEKGEGKFYIDFILEVFAEHENFELILN